LLALLAIAGTARLWRAEAAPSAPVSLDPSFQKTVKPFFKKNCMLCHNTENSTAGVRVDQLDSSLDDRQIPTWQAIRNRIKAGTMPPKGVPQPTTAERQAMVEWIDTALQVARSRPAPMNGLVRRLTIAQYRNTLRELLLLEDDLTSGLPPDAISKD